MPYIWLICHQMDVGLITLAKNNHAGCKKSFLKEFRLHHIIIWKWMELHVFLNNIYIFTLQII